MRIGLKLMLVFLIFTLLLTLLFYFIGLQNHNETLNETSLENIKNINDTFHTLEERDTKILSSALEVVIQDKGFKDIYLEKDRKKLYDYGLPLFQNLKNKSGITHFYFILPDGRVFVRLHNKEIYEDLVTRITFQKTKDTKKPSSGIELGKTAFALRTVAPYYNNGELIGYVELGEEIDHFLKILKADTNNEFAIIVDKEYLNRDDWKSVRQVAGLRDNWNDMEKHLILSSTSEEGFASECFVEDNLERIEKGENRFPQFQNKNQTFVCGGFTINDAGGRHIGAVLSLIDITDHVAIVQKSNLTLLVMAIILFVVTLTTGILISSSISKPITRLKDAANEIGKGNLNTKIEIKSNDEIGQLAASFKKMTEELQKTTVSKKYVDNIIKSMFDMMVVATPEGTIQTMNRATCDMLGYRAEELVGKNIDFIFADASSQSRRSWLDELIKKGSISNIEKTYRAKDGRQIPVLFSGSIMHDDGGKIQGIVCVAQDITERNRTMEELQQKNEFVKSTLESLTYPFYVIDASDYTIKMANSAASRGRLEEGSTCYALIHKSNEPCGSSEHQCPLEEVKRTRGPVTVEHVHYDNDGNARNVEVHGYPIFDKEGNVAQMIEYSLDITERKRAEKIQLENERLALASKAKAEFLATMSHELRTPLNSIIGFSELMKQKVPGELNEKQEHYLDNVITSGRNLLSLINSILDLSKVESGKMEIMIEKLSVPELINDSILLIKEKAAKQNIILKKELDPQLDFMETDRQRFKQVLFNMLSNAVKFSKKEGGTVTITAKKEGEMARFSVSDTGIGIKEEDMERLFKTFEQLDSGIAREYGGAGLGLAVSKKLVELHGGKIWVESRYGEGSTFTFIVPIVAKKPEEIK